VAARIGGIMTACPLLPPVLIDGRSNHEVVAITLLAPDGSVLYASGAPEAGLLAEHRLPDRMGGMTVQASVLPGVAGDLIIGGLPSSRVPLMIGVFTLAAILAGVAVAQLRRAQELARLRSDFVAGVSHELRTPLAQIRLYADTLALGRADAEDRRVWSVDGLRRETTRLEHLVDNILQFARAAGPAQATAASSLDLSQAVHDAVESYRPLALRHATIEYDGEPDVHVRAGPEAVRQIVGNLLDNAVKYGPRGQTIGVRVYRAGARARIEVEDDGPGVPATERDAVWLMYRRGARATGSEVGGSGIGLAVVRRIVEAHGGEVRIEDAPDGGARFVLELPANSPAIPPHVIPQRATVSVAD
jgi:signal transduction histidine kinase